MILRKLSLVNFKNIAAAEYDFAAGVNCFTGENGTGKTNLLDAVHYLSMCRSSLPATDRQSVRHGEEFFVVEGDFSDTSGSGSSAVVAFSNKSGKKSVKFCGKEYDRLSDHVGVVPTVMVSPADVFLISDAADERRRWLNSFVSQSDRDYLRALVRYNTVLAERNHVLKEGFVSGSRAEMLDVLDLQLAELGEKIHTRRAEVTEQLKPIVAEVYSRLSDDREQVELTYKSELSQRPFTEILAANREKDLANGFTTGGIHRDDVVMRIGGHMLRKYGSQGQQKSFLIALKLAQGSVIQATTGETPILLLDDLFDKLDHGRVERLLSLVSGRPDVQIFISDCNRARLEEVLKTGGHKYKLFELTIAE